MKAVEKAPKPVGDFIWGLYKEYEKNAFLSGQST